MRDSSIFTRIQLRHVLAIGMLFALAGCGQGGGAGLLGTGNSNLSMDPGDPCLQSREEFAKSKSYFTDEIFKGVSSGATEGVGNTLTPNASLLDMNTWSNAASKALTGMAQGGYKSYINTRSQESKDANELAKSVNEDLTQEGKHIDHTSATFARLRSCRFAQAATIKTSLRAGRMNRDTAKQQLAHEKDWFNEEIALAKQYQLSMEKRGAQFNEAANEIKQRDAANDAKASAIKQAASVSIPDKREGFGNEIKSAEAGSQVAFSIDSNKSLVRLEIWSDA